MAFRAFIAVEVHPSDSLTALLTELGNVGQGLKPVERENVHITLKFLGDIDETLVPHIGKCMESAADDVAPFIITLKSTGYFPPRGPAKTLWVGMEGVEPLVLIASKLEKCLAGLGFVPEERPFRPHLTIGRVKDNRAAFASENAMQRHRDEEFGCHEVSSIKLKKSVLGRFGPTYSDILEIGLH